MLLIMSYWKKLSLMLGNLLRAHQTLSSHFCPAYLGRSNKLRFFSILKVACHQTGRNMLWLWYRVWEFAQHGMNMASKDQHKIFMYMPSCIKSNMYPFSLYENEYAWKWYVRNFPKPNLWLGHYVFYSVWTFYRSFLWKCKMALSFIFIINCLWFYINFIIDINEKNFKFNKVVRSNDFLKVI